MAAEYFCAYHSILDSLKPYSDAERGRIFTACLEYSKTGSASELCGNERFILPTLFAQIDRDRAAYEKKCAKNKANATERMRTLANGSERSQGKGKEEGKDKGEGEYKNPPPPLETGFGEDLQSAFENWVAYKAERKEKYKPQGLKALISEIHNKAAVHGEAAIASLIQECMANGWKGIIFDRLKQPVTQKGSGDKLLDMIRSGAFDNDES